jgi:hypothetical protein
MSGHEHPLREGFFNELSLDPGDEEIFRFDDSECICACETCAEVRSGRALYLYRYLPNGRQIVKAKVVTNNG